MSLSSKKPFLFLVLVFQNIIHNLLLRYQFKYTIYQVCFVSCKISAKFDSISCCIISINLFFLQCPSINLKSSICSQLCSHISPKNVKMQRCLTAVRRQNADFLILDTFKHCLKEIFFLLAWLS